VIVNVDLGAGLGPVHSQGKRPTCLAFAISDLNRHANQVPSPLSAEYLYRSAAQQMPGWQPHAGLHLTPALSAASNPGQPIAAAYPYVLTEPAEKPPFIKSIPQVPVGYGQLHASIFQSGKVNAAGVESVLLGGSMIGLIIAISDSFYTPVNGVIAFSSMVVGNMLHAVVATGLGREQSTGLPHVRIRNTWGEGWGDAGNAWLPFGYLDQHIVQAFKV
jgi:hypothetical protein